MTRRKLKINALIWKRASEGRCTKTEFWISEMLVFSFTCKTLFAKKKTKILFAFSLLV